MKLIKHLRGQHEPGPGCWCKPIDLQPEGYVKHRHVRVDIVRGLAIALGASILLWVVIVTAVLAVTHWTSAPDPAPAGPRPAPEHQCLYGTSQVLKPCPSDARPSAVLVTSDRYADYWTEATRPNITVAVPK